MRRRAISKAALAEYRRARAALLRKLSRSRAAGFDVSSIEIPAIPKRVTWGSARRLRKLSAKISAQKKTGTIPKIVITDMPVFETKLLELFDNMIKEAEHYVEPDSTSKKWNSEEARIRKRGEEARQEFISHGLDTNTKTREIAERNLEKTWPELVELLEKFLYGSDGEYYGDLSNLFWIFYKLTAQNEISLEEKKKYAEGTGLLASEQFYGEEEYV